MAKEKIKYESMKELVKSVEALKEEIHSALGDETRIASDSKLAMSVDKEWKLTKAQTAGLGAAAGAAGVAAYFGPALPLIASTTLATGLIAWPLVAAGAGASAIGAVGGKIIHSKVTQKKSRQQLLEKKVEYIQELQVLQDRLKKQIELEIRAVEERRELLEKLHFWTARTIKVLYDDLKITE